ncbi:MAG: ADP-ribosylglycohydrolase family protein [Alphaproteobacteria bacterium]
MLGAIAGDIIGSIYEGDPIKRKDFPLFDDACTFTDDTVLTVAVADCLMNDGDFADYLRTYARRYPHCGFGGMFRQWAFAEDMAPYGSWGNGSAMRVSPVAHKAHDERHCLDLAARSSVVTHDHPDAVAGAQAVALAMWLAKEGRDARAIAETVAARFGYDLTATVDEIRGTYTFDVSAKGTVPQAIVCALTASDYEDAVRNAVSLGGDSDTLACIAGGIAEILHGIPRAIADTAMDHLEDDLRQVVERFRA